jgi:regulator of sigma E protease
LTLSWQHLVAFLVAVGLLVTIHEFGHYIVARALGFKVLRFSVGFGKALVRKVAGRDRTEYVLAAIPLGGYVKMLDEREGPVDPAELHRAFTRRPHWARILVLLAGPAFNIAFAILMLAALFMINGITDLKPLVGKVTPDTPAARAGLQSGQEILAVGGQPTPGQREVVLGLLDAVSGTEPVALRVRDEAGREREVELRIADSAERRRLTEPATLLTGLGLDFWLPPVPAVLGKVEPDGAAARAGLQPGDEILSFNGEPVTDFLALRSAVEARPGEEVAVTYRRDGNEASTRITLASDTSGPTAVGRLQVFPAATARYPDSMLRQSSPGPLEALSRGTVEAWEMTALQARIFWRMLMGQVSLKNLSGPLTIAEFAGDSASAGATSFAGFLVLISLSLGFLNLLPIPILDGGQIVYQLVEWAKGSPLSDRAQALGQQLGVALLVLLMSVALFNDIARQFS